MNQIIYSAVRRVCVFAHMPMYVTKCTDFGILNEPYINLKAIRIGSHLLLIQQTQSAVTLCSLRTLYPYCKVHLSCLLGLCRNHAFLNKADKLLNQ